MNRANNGNSYTTTTAGMATSAVNLAVAQNLTIGALLADATDTVTLEGYLFEILSR